MFLVLLMTSCGVGLGWQILNLLRDHDLACTQAPNVASQLSFLIR